MIWKSLKQSVLFPKGLNWVQHSVSRIGLLRRRVALKIVVANRPFLSSPGPLYRNEAKCSTFDMEMIFHFHANETHFHKKGCALGIILKVRVFGTRKWPIVHCNITLRVHVVLYDRQTEGQGSSAKGCCLFVRRIYVTMCYVDLVFKRIT